MTMKCSEKSIESRIEKIGSLGSPIHSPGRLENRDHNQNWVRCRPKDTRPPEYRFPKDRNKPAPMGNLLAMPWRVRSAFENYLDELVSCLCSFQNGDSRFLDLEVFG